MIHHLIYTVPDAEHMGDVDYDENKLRKLGAKIQSVDIDWGTEEINSACIYCTCQDNSLQELLNYGCYEEIYRLI